jgi:rRNA-processing protein FCF1
MLLIPFTLGVNVTDELKQRIDGNVQLSIMEKTMDELDYLVKTEKGKQKEAAKLAKKLVEHEKLHIIRHEAVDIADSAIVAYCKEYTQTIVATQDKELRTTLQDMGIRVAFVRSKSYIDIE